MIYIITGYEKETIDNYKAESKLVLNYPAVYKHPKFYCEEIDNILLTNKDVTIRTFSNVIINRIGYLIEKKILLC